MRLKYQFKTHTLPGKMECETAKSELSQYYSAVARMTYQNLFYPLPILMILLACYWLIWKINYTERIPPGT